MKKLLILLFTLICGLSAAFATDYTIFPDANVASYALPVAYINESHVGSITQQIYWAEELTDQGALAGDINAITFYYTANAGTTASAYSRSIQIYLMEVDNTTDVYTINAVSRKISGYDYLSHFLYDESTKKAGTKVYDGTLTTETVTSSNPINFSTDVKSLTIPITAFSWDGTKNIVVTVADVTNTSVSATNLRFLIASTKINSASYPRFAYKKWTAVNDTLGGWIDNFAGDTKWADKYGYTTTTYNTEDGQKSQRSYVNKVTFSISSPVPAPTSPTSSSVTSSSATIGWTAAAGAYSYEIRYGTTSGSLGAATNVGNVTSYGLTGLEEETTYYYQIRTKIGSEYSAWTSEASFTTLAEVAHTHDDITFSKWSSSSSLPTSGNYYLANDVTFGLLDGDVTLTGNLNLCLNGKTANLNGSRIIVPDGKTFTLFDNEGGGKITSSFPSSNGEMVSTGLITVAGTLVLHEGAIENTYVPDGDGTSIAVCISGTVELSGAPAISSNAIDFFVGNSSAITIAGALSNAAPYSVYKTLISDFTSGWNTAMGSANPADYFTSANASYGVCRNGNEARLVRALSWSGTVNNSTSISDNNGQLVNVTLASRTITSASYNTLCLPFNLSNDELQEAFGSGYDLEEFTGSSLDATTLNLSFTQRTSLVAGKPYLILPSVTAVDPSFVGVTISATTPSSSTSEFADFIGIYNPTELTVDNRNTLFLGASNTLFFPSETANMPGFRGYFSVKGGAQQAIQAVIFPQHTSPTGIENVNQKSEIKNHKYLIDGQLIIIRDGIEYNAQGIRL